MCLETSGDIWLWWFDEVELRSPWSNSHQQSPMSPLSPPRPFHDTALSYLTPLCRQHKCEITWGWRKLFWPCWHSHSPFLPFSWGLSHWQFTSKLSTVCMKSCHADPGAVKIYVKISCKVTDLDWITCVTFIKIYLYIYIDIFLNYMQCYLTFDYILFLALCSVELICATANLFIFSYFIANCLY